MRKRRIEIAILAALIVLASAERPSIGVGSATYQVDGFAPHRVATVRDLGAIAVKLLVEWID